MKAKVFFVTSPVELQQELNKWLRENPEVEISHALQSESFDDVGRFSITCTLLYKGGKEDEAEPLQNFTIALNTAPLPVVTQ